MKHIQSKFVWVCIWPSTYKNSIEFLSLVMPRHTLHAATIRNVAGITATRDAIVSSDTSAPERICIENRVVAQHFLAPHETNQKWAVSKEYVSGL